MADYNGDYRLDIYNTSGVMVGQYGDFLSLSVSKRVNRMGKLIAQFTGTHSLASLLSRNYRIELFRRDPTTSVGFYKWWSGFFRTPRFEYRGTPTFQLTALDDKYLLSTRAVAYAAETSNRSLFTSTAAETIMKTLVSYNCTSAASVLNGRIRAGTITGLAVQADGANGNVISSWACFADNLLETLTKLSRIAGGDFDIVKLSATNWEFRWYTGQLGTDRSATVKFSIDRGNLIINKYEIDRSAERTVMIVGGRGTGSDREFVVRTGADYDVSLANSEDFLNASNLDTNGMNTAGDNELKKTRAVENFDFELKQTESVVYDRDFYLGDLVTVINPFTAASVTHKITDVTIAINEDGSEEIDFDAAPVP